MLLNDTVLGVMKRFQTCSFLFHHDNHDNTVALCLHVHGADQLRDGLFSLFFFCRINGEFPQRGEIVRAKGGVR